MNGALAPVSYPLWQNDRNHRRLTLLYRPHNELGLRWRQAYPSDDWRFRRMIRHYRRFLFAELGAASAAVISSENLSNFSTEHVARLRADLEYLGFTEFHVVLYVRDPANFYLSRTQQRLKTWHEPRIPDPTSFTYKFRRAAQTWERVFPGRLIVRRALDAPGEDVTDDFSGLLENNLDVSLPPLPERMNTTLSAEGMQILMDYRQRFWRDNGGLRTPDVRRLVKLLKASRTRLPQTQPALKDEVAAQIRANHSADAEVMSARYGLDLDLGNPVRTAPPPSRPEYRVQDIVRFVDPDIVRQLLLELARTELGRPLPRRPLPLRMGARVYRYIPNDRRSQRLDDWLRTFVNRER